jgi:hypothetical protein
VAARARSRSGAVRCFQDEGAARFFEKTKGRNISASTLFHL